DAGETQFVIRARGVDYKIDLGHMTQTNLKSNRTRTIRVVDRHLAEQGMDFDAFRSAFKERSADGKLTKEVLVASWTDKEKPEEDSLLLQLTAAAVTKEMDLRGGQQIDMTCWNHYWALERDNGSYHSALEVNQQLTRALKSDSQVLGRMQMHFETAVGDSGDTGAHGLTSAGLLKACERLAASPADVLEKQWAKELLGQHAAGEEVLEEDEVLSYCDYLNVMFGRKRYKVYLWMYDISDGFAARWSWLLLGKDFKGIWHTGVVVEWPDKSSEFWFGGRIFDSQPGTTPFGEPVERRFLGYTYKRRAETWEYLTRHCASEFTRENYDVLTHNCNHFSEKLHMFLRNEHIPDEVLKQPDMVMQTITARALRPLLNRWLGGFESKDGRSTDGGEAARALWDSLSPGALVEFVHEDSGRPLVGKVLSLRDNSAAQVASLNLLQQSMVQQEVLRTSITKMLRSAPKPIPRTREATTGPACCPSICQLD
ncbi:DESI1, partial [Symbiodinium sp. CCMP2456]